MAEGADKVGAGVRAGLGKVSEALREDAAASLRQIATQSRAMADAVQKYALSESLAEITGSFRKPPGY